MPTDVADTPAFKRPESVLVVVYTDTGKVLLMKRRDHAHFWQSVTGSLDWHERDARLAAARELGEETGLDAASLRDLGSQYRYAILPEWRHRYASGVSHNLEHAYALRLPEERPIALSPEHSAYGWFGFREAALKVASWSNREAIERVAAEHGRAGGQAVVLVHGLWLAGWAMSLLARGLRQAGFRPYLFSYPSLRRTLRENARALRDFSDTVPGNTLHYVGHSLGGVVIQRLLADFPPTRPGRVVTLASPHAGCDIARSLARHSWGPGLLGAGAMELVRGLPASPELRGREVGLIKGTRPLGLGRLIARLDRPNDGVVAVDEARWPGATDELVLPVAHTEMLVSREVTVQVGEFLRRGTFRRPAKS